MAEAIGPDLSAIGSAQEPMCTSKQYKENNPPDQQASAPFQKSTCDQCKSAFTSAKGQAQSAGSSAIGADQGAASSATPGINNASNGVESQLISQNNTSGKNYSPGAAAQQARSGIANSAASGFQQCVTQVQGACSGGLASEDKQAADKLKEACQNGAKDAGQFGSEKAADASQMGDLSKLASQAAQALGPLAQMMGGGGDKGGQTAANSPYTDPNSSSGITGTAPTPDSPNNGNGSGSSKIDPVAGTSLGATKTAMSSVGLDSSAAGNGLNGSAANASNTIGLKGDGSSGANGSGGKGLGGQFSALGVPGGSLGSAGMGGSLGMGGGGGSLGAGGGMAGNSSGASSAADYKNPDAAAGGTGDGFDLSGGRPMVGLKGGGKSSEASELESLAGANNVGSSAMDDGMGEDRSPASESGVGSESGLSLFKMVRIRYAELKRSGNI